MPWISSTRTPGATLGIEAAVQWRRPSFVPDAEPFVDIPMPADVGGVDEIPTDCQYEGTRYAAGGFTQNTLVTRDLDFWSQGIEAPLEIPNVSLTGTGITGAIVCYWRYFDYKTGELSPLSGGKSLSPANQSIRWTSFPISMNPRVTHIELWVSIDGSLPRFLLRRQVGVSGNIDTAPTVADLGAADTEEFDKFPRCRVNALYHDRQFGAGDEEARDTLYCSLIGLPERRSSITLKTRNGEPIIALHVVGDGLLVFCPFSTYVVQGFTEDDLNMQVVKPDVGIIGPNAKAMVHGQLYVFAHVGLYIWPDATGGFFVGDDIRGRWASEYRAAIVRSVAAAGSGNTLLSDPSSVNNYETSWAVNDTKSYCVRLYVKKHSDTDNLFTFWVAHYEPSGPTLEGGFRSPLYSYDTSQNEYTCGAMMTLPGSRQSELFSAAKNPSDGFRGDLLGAYLYRENVTSTFDPSSLLIVPAPTDHPTDGFLLRLGGQFLGDEGGDIAHGKRFTEISLFLLSVPGPSGGNPGLGFNVKAWTGDVYGALHDATLFYQKAGVGDQIVFSPVLNRDVATEAVIDSDSYPDTTDGRVVTAQQPKTTWPFPIARGVGDSISIELQCFDPVVTFYGYQVAWKSGPKYRQKVSQVFTEGS